MAQATQSVFEAQCRLNGLMASTQQQLNAAREIATAAGRWPKPWVKPPPIQKMPTKALLFLVTVPETVIVKGGRDGDERVVLDSRHIECDIRETLYLHGGDLRFDKIEGAAVKFIEDDTTREMIEELEPELVYHFEEEPEVRP